LGTGAHSALASAQSGRDARTWDGNPTRDIAWPPRRQIRGLGRRPPGARYQLVTRPPWPQPSPHHAASATGIAGNSRQGDRCAAQWSDWQAPQV